MPSSLSGLPKNRQCALFPWLKCRTWHHTHSAAYRPTVAARMGWNCVPVSGIGHWVLHGLLGGTGRMVIKEGSRYWGGTAQRNIGAIAIQNHNSKEMFYPDFWQFPNPLQRLAHAWCRITFFLLWVFRYGRNTQSSVIRIFFAVLITCVVLFI